MVFAVGCRHDRRNRRRGHSALKFDQVRRVFLDSIRYLPNPASRLFKHDAMICLYCGLVD